MPDKFIVPERVTREAYIDLLEQLEAEKKWGRNQADLLTDCATENERLKEQFEVYREFYAAWWEVEKGVADFDLHSEAVTRLSEAHAAVIRLDSNPAKERDPALCRHGYDLTQEAECPLCKAQEALSEWEPARWCRRCGVYGCEHVLPAQSPAKEPS